MLSFRIQRSQLVKPHWTTLKTKLGEMPLARAGSFTLVLTEPPVAATMHEMSLDLLLSCRRRERACNLRGASVRLASILRATCTIRAGWGGATCALRGCNMYAWRCNMRAFFLGDFV